MLREGDLHSVPSMSKTMPLSCNSWLLLLLDWPIGAKTCLLRVAVEAIVNVFWRLTCDHFDDDRASIVLSIRYF